MLAEKQLHNQAALCGFRFQISTPDRAGTFRMLFYVLYTN
jgi:hypothetical protein